MGRVKTFANGGSLLPGDLNAIEDDYEFGFSTYRHLLPNLQEELQSATNGTTYILREGFASTEAASGNAAGLAAFYLDPADLTANTRTNKYRLRVSLLTNATAPTSTFTVGLYPVTGVAGGAGANTITLGAVTGGSTVTFAAPGASSTNQGNSGDFAAPAAGYYAVCVAITIASMAANSNVAMRAILQARQV